MTSNEEIWDVIYFGMWDDMKLAFAREGESLDPEGFLGQVCRGYADAIVGALLGVAGQPALDTALDTETYAVQPGLMAPHITHCTFTKIDPKNVQVTFNGIPITGIASGRTIVGDLDGDSWEECTAAELVPGDVVTHIQVGRQWVECKQQNGDKSAGFRVVGDDKDGVYGLVLLADGSSPAGISTLFSLDNPARLRVVPWDSKPAVKVACDRWNGTCAACGKGTYTGFTSTEHDGPCKE